MTNEQMLERLQARTGVTDTALLETYIEDAAQAVINKAYPFKTGIETVPKKYQNIQLEIAVYLVNKRGAEEQTEHIENGIHRMYESAYIPNSLLRAVIPLAKIPSSEEEDDENP